MIRKEEWRLIPGFRNYAISNFGEVQNVDTGRILSPGTRAENIQHAYDTGLINPSRQRASVRPVRVVETGVIYESAEACGREIGGVGSSVRAALTASHRTHLGLHFEYADEVMA